jgi:hypothetical protein
MGAAGVPQPVIVNPMASARAAHPRLCAVLIALPVYWSGAGRDGKPGLDSCRERGCAGSGVISRRQGTMWLLAAIFASTVKLIDLN